MRRLIMWNMVTLDGFFEGPNPWEIDWHNDVWGDELERLSLEQLRGADTLLFGRKTYEGMASYWRTAEGAEGEVAELMNRIPKVVFSRTLEQADWNNTRLVREQAEETVRSLTQEPGKDMYIFGSANLSATLMQAGLIDELRLGMNPLALGAGNPLFKPEVGKVQLKLLDALPYKSGVVILRYEFVRASRS